MPALLGIRILFSPNGSGGPGLTAAIAEWPQGANGIGRGESSRDRAIILTPRRSPRITNAARDVSLQGCGTTAATKSGAM